MKRATLPSILAEPDFILSALIFFLSLSVSVYAYATVRNREHPHNALVESIREGVQHFKIMSSADCPGDLTITIAHDAAWSMKSEGNLRISYGKAVSVARFEMSSNFNPLDQLNSASVIIAVKNFSIAIRANQPNPISVTIQTAGDGPNYHQELSIPGPVLVVKNDDGSYRIEYAYLPMSQSPSAKAAQGLFAHELALSLVPAETAPPACDRGGESRLDLLPLSIQTMSFVQPLLAFVGENSAGKQ